MAAIRSDRFTSTKQDTIYADFLTDFTPHPITHDLVRATNEQAVIRSIRNLVSTNKGDRLYSDTGSSIRSLLFENVNGADAESLSIRIQETIIQHEPRAKILSVIVRPDYDNHLYTATITFMLINKEDPITTVVNLYRVR